MLKLQIETGNDAFTPTYPGDTETGRYELARRERTMTKLTETRAADRAVMARRLADAMLSEGATVIVEPSTYAPRRIDVRITAPGGATIHVDFDGDSYQPDCHVATWNTPRGVYLSPALGDVNPFHYGKLNRVGHGLSDLISRLRADVARFAAGSGYLSDNDDRIVAMRERDEAQRERLWKEYAGGELQPA